ncbi:MAG: cation:proton antiporter [Rickettsiales bacterium]|nr:MAG: cation:proton antiporter [Rickettsiales bacterium]
MFLNILVLVIFLFAIIIAAGAILQRDIFTKILFLNVSTTIISLFICFIATYKVNSSYIDIAIIYFILSIIVSSAYLKYFIQSKKQKEQNSDEVIEDAK